MNNIDENAVLKAAQLLEPICRGAWNGTKAVASLVADGMSQVDATEIVDIAAERLDDLIEAFINPFARK